MFRLLSRIVAVTALAAAPVIGSSVAQAANRDAWPVYPSMFATGCQINGTLMVCGAGGLLQSQINSGYQCSEIDISENGYGSGPVLLTMTANDQSVSQSVSIDSNGTWFVQFPGFLVNNLVSLEFSSPDGSVFNLPTIQANPCAVATSTPTAAPSSTPNPSFTPTATINPSYTVTPIPTFTPLPSGHSTFTATATRTPGPAATSTATSTPIPAGPINCGGPSFPLLDCNMFGSPRFGIDGFYGMSNPPWLSTNSFESCLNDSGNSATYNPDAYWQAAWVINQTGSTRGSCAQTVIVPALGVLHVSIAVGSPLPSAVPDTSPVSFSYAGLGGTWDVPVGTTSSDLALGAVPAGSITFLVSAANTHFLLTSAWVVVAGTTSTPTPTVTATGTPLPEPTPTGTATLPPLPGAHETPIPTDTECPGGCAVTDLTQVPGLSTVVTVDTNPFSPLTHLSLTRSSCQPFGYVQIPIPVITGTPALGQPLQFGWTAPITHTWDDTHLITNTAIQPCAMVGEVSPYVWDFTYWGSGVALAIVFTIWLIGWVGRLSGDHTING